MILNIIFFGSKLYIYFFLAYKSFQKIRKKKNIVKIREWVEQNQERILHQDEKITFALELDISYDKLEQFIKNANRRYKRRKKLNIQKKEIALKAFKDFFDMTKYPTKSDFAKLSTEFNINENKIESWFARERSRIKREKEVMNVFTRK